VRSFLRDDALKGIRVMNKVTKSKLRKSLATALQDGLGPVETARKIRDVFDEAKTVRALRVARTETLKAANHGALEAYKQSGVVIGKQWLTISKISMFLSHSVNWFVLPVFPDPVNQH
jgi:hypothetical protein